MQSRFESHLLLNATGGESSLFYWLCQFFQCTNCYSKLVTMQGNLEQYSIQLIILAFSDIILGHKTKNWFYTTYLFTILGSFELFSTRTLSLCTVESYHIILNSQIFKNGKKSTINLIEKHDVHFVSVLWVDSCKQTWSRVDEESFPVAKTDTGSPLGLFRAKSKRLKSLQPKAFDEDLNHSGSKFFIIVLLRLLT